MFDHAMFCYTINFTECPIYFDVFLCEIDNVRLYEDGFGIFTDFRCCAAFGTVVLAYCGFWLGASCENVCVWNEDLDEANW